MATSLFRQITVISVVIVILAPISNNCVFAQNEMGKACTYSKTNEAGMCKLVKDCPEAVKAIKSHSLSPSDICGYQDTSALVCCVVASNPPPTQPHSAVVTSTTSSPVVTLVTTEKPMVKEEKPVTTESKIITESPTLNFGDKSKAKCQEYEEYVYTYAVAGAPRVTECKAKLSAIPSIIGGVAVEPKEFPHMAIIGYENSNNQTLWLCGGSLISERYILTAGHCLNHDTYQDAKFVRLGDIVLDTDDDDAETQDFTVAEIIKHPRYFKTSKYNDIGLLKLDRNARLNSYVRPACLDTQPHLNLNVHPTATGWGETGFAQNEAKDKGLLKVTLDYFTEKECNATYRNSGVSLRHGIIETQICTGSRNESKDTCQGDSGGPLQVLLTEPYCMYSIVGITSFGKICGVAQIPGVYTRVYSYLEWIENTVWP